MKILALDPDRVLDESEAGKSGAAALQAEFEAAREKFEKMRQSAKSAPISTQKALLDEMQAFERNELTTLEKKRTALRAALLTQVRPILQTLRETHGAGYVLDARVVLACAAEDDITDEVIAQLDASS